MKKIESFTINHMTLLPGVYVSRRDVVSPSDAFDDVGRETKHHAEYGRADLYPVTTYDIRMTRPNFEPVMTTAEVHTIEHLGATYLRNQAKYSERVIYWGPMGCRTGFYLIMAGSIPVETVKDIMIDMFKFISCYDGAIPGATPEECGNYSDMDLPGANKRARAYAQLLENSGTHQYEQL